MSNLMVIEEREVLGKEFRIYGDFDNPLFLAKDVADWIEHSNPTEMVRTIDDNEKLNSTILSAGQNREVTFLTEDGLYEVLMQSRKPIAKEFKMQVKQILKDIRKHGIYATDNTLEKIIGSPEFGIRLLTEIKAERDKTKQLQEENAINKQIIGELQPKASYYDLILQNKTLMPITKIAKDYGMSGQAMNSLLHELGVQFKMGDAWLLYQKHADQGYTQSKTYAIDADKSKISTAWTQKGRLFIYDLLKNQKGILPVIETEHAANLRVV